MLRKVHLSGTDSLWGPPELTQWMKLPMSALWTTLFPSDLTSFKNLEKKKKRNRLSPLGLLSPAEAKESVSKYLSLPLMLWLKEFFL